MMASRWRQYATDTGLSRVASTSCNPSIEREWALRESGGLAAETGRVVMGLVPEGKAQGVKQINVTT